MLKVSNNTFCVLSGMYSSVGQGYTCHIVEEEINGLSGLWWKLKGSGHSSHQHCYAYCLEWNLANVSSTSDTSGHASLTSEFQVRNHTKQSMIPATADSIC